MAFMILVSALLWYHFDTILEVIASCSVHNDGLLCTNERKTETSFVYDQGVLVCELLEQGDLDERKKQSIIWKHVIFIKTHINLNRYLT